MSHVDVAAPPFFNMDFLKLHSQMNPHLRADRNIMPRTKSQKCRTKDGQCGNWSIKNVAFSVKTACTLLIVCDGLVRAAAPSVDPLQMSTVCEVWICGRLADGPSPARSQPACQQHLLLGRASRPACCATFYTVGVCGFLSPSFLAFFYFFYTFHLLQLLLS